ncbi:MAG: hypothetical protein K8R74_09685, partial [Bacteroidales bacterium]|nr:hypothetical protein [Bacteroidales bacterium]
MKRSLILILMFILVGCVASQQDLQIQEEIIQNKIQGTWEVVSITNKYPQKTIRIIFGDKNNYDIIIDDKHFVDHFREGRLAAAVAHIK